MSESTKRAVRTAFQVLIAVLTFLPVAFGLLPYELSASEAVVTFGVWVAFVTKLHNAAEAAGLIPEWLKDDAPAR